MKVGRCEKESFVVIGKEGTTTDGDDFIQRLWADADAHFDEIQPLTKTDADGKLAGIWGVMSDFRIHSGHGRISAKDFTWPGSNVRRMPKRRRGGRNGLFRAMSSSMWSMTMTSPSPTGYSI